MKKIVLGLTGQTGAGKSSVSQYLRQQGCAVIDADQVARSVVEKGSACIADVILAFGCDYLTAEGDLNRRKLAESVFTDREKLKKLNDIMFPYIVERIGESVDAARKGSQDVILLDAPTLFESGCDRFCDKVVSVIATRQSRLERIMARDGLSQEEAEHRISAQHDDVFYLERSWTVLQNNGDLQDLYAQADSLLLKLRAPEEASDAQPSGEEAE